MFDLFLMEVVEWILKGVAAASDFIADAFSRMFRTMK